MPNKLFDFIRKETPMKKTLIFMMFAAPLFTSYVSAQQNTTVFVTSQHSSYAQSVYKLYEPKIVKITKPTENAFGTATVEFSGIMEANLCGKDRVSLLLQEGQKRRAENYEAASYFFSLVGYKDYAVTTKSIPDSTFCYATSRQRPFRMRYTFNGWPKVPDFKKLPTKIFFVKFKKFGAFGGGTPGDSKAFRVVYTPKTDTWSIR